MRAPILAFLLSGLFCGIAAGGEGTAARAIIDKYAATLPADEQVDVRLDIYRRVGIGEVDLSKPRISVSIRRSIRGRGAAAKVRIDVMKPTSMAGIAMTAAWNTKTRKHEVLRFLPGSSALRRMGYLSTSFLQSHLIYEDVAPLVVAEHNYAAKGEKKVSGADCQVIEATPKRPSAYAKLIYYIRKSDSKAAKVEYWARGYRGAELKKTRIIKADGTEEWTTAKTKEKTLLTFSNRKAEAPAEARFNPESLKSNPSLVQLMKERAKLLEQEDKVKREIAKLKTEIEKLEKAK
jgi:Outer membrane lipoprotein-sorting protein